MVRHTSTSVWKHGLLGCHTVFHVTDVVQVVMIHVALTTHSLQNFVIALINIGIL